MKINHIYIPFYIGGVMILSLLLTVHQNTMFTILTIIFGCALLGVGNMMRILINTIQDNESPQKEAT